MGTNRPGWSFLLFMLVSVQLRTVSAETPKLQLPGPVPQANLPLPVAPALKTPVVTGFYPPGCIDKGDTFSIVGKGFGASQEKRSAALGRQNLHVDLPVVRWSDSRILVKLPEDPGIQAGEWYYAGIEHTGHRQWESNIDRNIQVCAAKDTASGLSTPEQTSGRDTVDAPDNMPAAGTGSENNIQTLHSAGASLLGQPLPAPPQAPEYADVAGVDESSEPDEILILSADMPQALQLQQLGAGMGLTVKRRHVLQGLGLVVTTLRIPDGTTPLQAVQQLRSRAPDLWVDVNHRMTLQGSDDAHTYPARMIAWPGDVHTCGQGLQVGIADGPLPEQHPALSGARITRRSFVTQGVKSASSEHALAVAAILVGGDGRGLIPAAALYSAEVMRQRDKKHIDTTVDWLVQGLDWLALQHVDLINLSLGGPHSLILDAAVQRLLDLKIPVIAAAGNQGPAAGPVYPAAQQGVLAVTAIDAERRLYRHANRGDFIAFAAPGVDIWVPRGEGHVFMSGTSFAAPYVTALLAVRRQAQPLTGWEDQIRALISSAQDLGEPGRDALFGYGLPQAHTACGKE